MNQNSSGFCDSSVAAESLGRLRIEMLRPEHAAELWPVLGDPRIYEFIPEARPGSAAEFERSLARMCAGPSVAATASGEAWVNAVVRRAADDRAIGRIQATVVGGRAEVAFLFAPESWGYGYAAEALGWLHEHLRSGFQVVSFWATARPENVRSHRLLERLGYRRIEAGWPELRGFDEGDWVFGGRRGERRSSTAGVVENGSDGFEGRGPLPCFGGRFQERQRRAPIVAWANGPGRGGAAMGANRR